jgi:predicted nucleic acid-binding protein
MNFSSILTDPDLPLAIDTSVVVNLHACTFGVQIMAAIPNRIILPQIAADELKAGTSERDFVDNLVNQKMLELSELTDDEYELYENLISSLDDGESATLAIAITRKLFPTIDEKKGRTRAIALVPALEPGWSLDLLRHPQVLSKLGSPSDVEALYLALREGRMRIPDERAEEVIALIGKERAAECLCLPDYKLRFGSPPKQFPKNEIGHF